MCTGPGRPSNARFTASSRMSQVSSILVTRNEPLVVAANMSREFGVRFQPEVSLSEPLPFHSIGA